MRSVAAVRLSASYVERPVSTTIEIDHPRPVERATFALGLQDLRWIEEPSWPLPNGTWSLYRDRISTRTTEVRREADRLHVKMAVGASDEDRRLALSLVRRATLPGAKVRAEEFGEVTADEVDACLDEVWQEHQLASAARIAMVLAREKGLIQMPGPTRSLCVGRRVLAELEAADEPARGSLLVSIMRRVLWPDPRYESAGRFQATSPSGRTMQLAFLLPERACVLPWTEELALEDETGPFLIRRSALDALPVSSTYLDDGNQLVEAIPASAWPAFCREARRHDVDGRRA
jgi:hypothetical protein